MHHDDKHAANQLWGSNDLDVIHWLHGVDTTETCYRVTGNEGHQN